MNRPKENFMRRAVRAGALLVPFLVGAFSPHLAAAVPGGTGFAFLKVGVGARAMGMGSAYVALADDPTASYWNPAGLASIRNTQVTAMHNDWILDFRQEYAAVGAPLGPGSVGFSFTGFYADEFEQRDITGTLTGHFGFNDIAVSGAYGLEVTKGLNGGAAVRYVREMIDNVDATALTFDLGALYHVAESGVSLGGTVQNIGGDAKFLDESFPLPLTYRLGGAFSKHIDSLKGRGTLSAEYRKAREDDGHFHVGGEYAYKDHLALRVGGMFGYDDQDVTFGVGLMKDWFRFDYALAPTSSDLGTTHFFSLTGSF
jgi:hypothetical protein